MALYVRCLTIRKHFAELTVAREVGAYSAILRLFASGPGSRVIRIIQTEGENASDVDRAAQKAGREYLDSRPPAPEESQDRV